MHCHSGVNWSVNDSLEPPTRRSALPDGAQDDQTTGELLRALEEHEGIICCKCRRELTYTHLLFKQGSPESVRLHLTTAFHTKLGGSSWALGICAHDTHPQRCPLIFPSIIPARLPFPSDLQPVPDFFQPMLNVEICISNSTTTSPERGRRR